MLRPPLQRGLALGHQFAAIVNASNAATRSARMVHAQLDHVWCHAKLGELGDEGSAQIVDDPSRDLHGLVEAALDAAPAADRRAAGGGKDQIAPDRNRGDDFARQRRQRHHVRLPVLRPRAGDDPRR